MNILLLYNATQTFTNTVFEHVDAFSRFSAHHYFFCHHDVHVPFDVDLGRFDAVGFHYSVRFPYDQISPAAQEKLRSWRGLKFLFIQDEYEHTHRAWHWIRELGIDLVFTVVPQASIHRVYPPSEFPRTRFVSNLTGYVPEEAPPAHNLLPPSQRAILVGYRGRPLPLVQFGALAYEKTQIGELVRGYCRERAHAHDLDWREQARIYGHRWYEFVASCRATLGTESGSNVFDWDGRLRERVAAFRAQFPDADDEAVYRTLVEPLEMHGAMNQVSPRVFEAISLRTVLVLFEGTYSGVVEPWRHFIPLRKDGSNLDEVFACLGDGAFVDAMADRAYQDVIASGRFGYPSFVQMTDREMERSAAELACDGGRVVRARAHGYDAPTPLTSRPARAAPPAPPAPPPAPVTALLCELTDATPLEPEQPLPQAQPECLEDPIPQPDFALQGQVQVPSVSLATAEAAPREQRAEARRRRAEARRQRAALKQAVRATAMKNLVVRSWQLVPPGVRPVLRPVARAGVLPAWRLLRRAYAKLRP